MGGVEPGCGDPVEHAVSIPGGGPDALVDVVVAGITEQDEVGGVGAAVVVPVDAVVALGPYRWDAAAGSAAPAEHASGEDLVITEQPFPTAQKEWHAGLVEDRWDDFGVT